MGRKRTTNGTPQLVSRGESPYYQIQWYDPVRRKLRRQSTGTGDLAAAQEKLRGFLAAGDGSKGSIGRAESAQSEADAEHTVVSVVQAFYDQYAYKQKQASAVRAAIKHFQAFFADTRMRELPQPGDNAGETMEDVVEAYAEWRAGDGTSPFTINRELATLRTAFNALKRGRPELTVPEVPYLEEPDIEPNWITAAEFERLVTHAPFAHTRTFMELLIGTASRPGALFELEWSQVDFRSGRIRLNPMGRVQTSKHRPSIHMTDRLATYLAEVRAANPNAVYVLEIDGKRIASNLKKSFRRAVEAAGLDPRVVTPKTLRHTCASWMAQDGMSMKKVAAFLGHASTRMVEKHYGHLHPDYQKEAVGVLERRLDGVAESTDATVARHKNGVAPQKRPTTDGASSENTPKPAGKLVEPAGLEPATSTMPL